MSLPACLKASGDAVVLTVKLQPRASRNQIGGLLGDALKVKVTAPPVDSAANEALLHLLAETLDCPRSAVKLVRGHTSRLKVLVIHGLDSAEVWKRLGG